VNPLLLLGLGALALMVMGRKKPTEEAEDGIDELPPPPPLPDEEVPEPEVEPPLLEVQPIMPPAWAEYFSPEGVPTLGTFYLVQPEDVNLQRIASRALWGTMTGPESVAYARCINSGRWNRYFFGVPSTASWAVDGMSADRALLRINDDAMAALAAGRWPELMAQVPDEPVHGETQPMIQTVPVPYRVPVGRRQRGLLWLPPAEVVVPDPAFPGIVELQCPSIAARPDGSSPIDPPPAILDVLGGNPPWGRGPR
jgi:hypothetical protein